MRGEEVTRNTDHRTLRLLTVEILNLPVPLFNIFVCVKEIVRHPQPGS